MKLNKILFLSMLLLCIFSLSSQISYAAPSIKTFYHTRNRDLGVTIKVQGGYHPQLGPTVKLTFTNRGSLQLPVGSSAGRIGSTPMPESRLSSPRTTIDILFNEDNLGDFHFGDIVYVQIYVDNKVYSCSILIGGKLLH